NKPKIIEQKAQLRDLGIEFENDSPLSKAPKSISLKNVTNEKPVSFRKEKAKVDLVGLREILKEAMSGKK
ncbi:hypothetical protein KKH96_03790, partial [Patescibacteria group bacterium]|nr:hypothetical protein [Patescibacteria group bacterium]